MCDAEVSWEFSVFDRDDVVNLRHLVFTDAMRSSESFTVFNKRIIKGDGIHEREPTTPLGSVKTSSTSYIAHPSNPNSMPQYPSTLTLPQTLPIGQGNSLHALGSPAPGQSASSDTCAQWESSDPLLGTGQSSALCSGRRGCRRGGVQAAWTQFSAAEVTH